MQQQDPIFPLEIFGRIIDILAEEPAAAGQMMTIKQSSLVCRAFMHFTRPHIFRQAKILFNKHEGARLERLLQMIEAKPDIRRHVQELDFDLERYSELTIPEYTHERCNNFLLHTPNVHSIKFSYSSATHLHYLSPDHLSDFCNRILTTHLAQGTLRSLDAKKMDKLPYGAIFGSVSFRSLRLDRCEWPILYKPIVHLTSLSLRKIYALPISLFQYFPNLEELTLDAVSFNTKPETPSYATTQFIPSLRLTTLSLHTQADQYEEFVDYLQLHGKKYNTGPFEALTSLTLHVDYPTASDVQAVKDLFPYMVSLRHLAIKLELFRERIPLTELDLDGQMATTFTSLQSISLTLESSMWSTSYDPVVQSLGSIFTIANPNSMLRYIDVKLHVDPLGRRQTIEPWPFISLLLKNCLRFPRMERIRLKLLYSVEDEDIPSEDDIVMKFINEIHSGLNKSDPESVAVNIIVTNYDHGTKIHKATVVFQPNAGRAYHPL